MTVIIRDDTPMICCGESPSYRSVRVKLTMEQREALSLFANGYSGNTPLWEEISRVIIESPRERRRTMPDKSCAFIDRKCPRCDGEGTLKAALPTTFCPLCKGAGTVGTYQEVPSIELHPTPFSKLLRSIRERGKITLRDLSRRFGMPPSRLSGLETGRETPTPGEEKTIREWMEENR